MVYLAICQWFAAVSRWEENIDSVSHVVLMSCNLVSLSGAQLGYFLSALGNIYVKYSLVPEKF